LSADDFRRRLRVSQSHGDPGAVILRVDGQLDADTVLLLARAVAGVLFRDPAPRILVLDLAGLSFVSVAGVRMLHTAQNHAAARNVIVRVVPGHHPVVLDTLHTTGLDAVLDLYAGRQEAVAAETFPTFLAEADWQQE